MDDQTLTLHRPATHTPVSALQACILHLAMHNRRTDGRSGADVRFREVLAAHFGFCAPAPLRGADQGRYHFDPETIGRERYASSLASLSRSVSRLRRRGFIEVVHSACGRWAGVNLTESGLALAEQLETLL